ncbi:MAG: 50S ribosomal protein L11 methyltransferase [Anaerolineae bacterium]|nr:50S ribosomal protein L11 methyltransferase [Anaerolineae bacterium]
MDFIEIALIDLNGEAAETVSELFNRYGYGGAVMESYPPDFDKVTVRTVIPSEDDHRLREIELMLALIGQALPGGLPEPRLQFVGKSDWAESWKAHFHPVRVGRRFVIKPSWRDYTATPDDIVIEIDPGLAFGSGLHPTTQLCLKILEEMPLAGQTLFDVGTGSGILALAALKLGAAKVRAVDIDDIAVRVTEENFERNGYPLPQKDLSGTLRENLTGLETPVEVEVGSAGEAGGRQWDIVVANILANTIIELLPDLKAALARSGSLILSGIIAEQEASVTAAATAHGLRFSERRVEEDWVALVFRTG